MGEDEKFFPAALYPVMFISGMVLIFPGPILDSLLADFGISKAAAGRLPLLFFSGGFLGVLFLSEISRMIGPKRTFLSALLFSGLSLFLIGLVKSFYLLLPLFFICGFANNMLFSLAGVITTRLSRKNVGSSVTRLYAFFSLGVTLGPILSGWILRKGFGYQPVLFQLAGLNFLVLVWVLTRKIPALKDIEKMTWSGFSRLIKSSGLLFFLLLLGQFFYVASEQGASVWIPEFLLNKFPDENIQRASLVLSGVWFLFSVGRFFFGWLSKRLDRRVILIGLALISALSSAAAAWSSHRLACEMWYLAFGLGMSGIYPLIVSYTEGFPPRYLSMGLTLILAFSSLGGAIGSYPVGILAERLSFSTAMLYPSLLLLFLLIIFPFLKNAFNRSQTGAGAQSKI